MSHVITTAEGGYAVGVTHIISMAEDMQSRRKNNELLAKRGTTKRLIQEQIYVILSVTSIKNS